MNSFQYFHLRALLNVLSAMLLIIMVSCSDIPDSTAQKVFPSEPFINGTLITKKRLVYQLDYHFRWSSYIPDKYDIRNEDEDGIQYIWHDDEHQTIHVYLSGFNSSAYRYYLLYKFAGKLKDQEINFYGLIDAATKKEILPCIYNRIDVISQNIFEITKNEKKAIFNLSNHSLSEFKYKEIAGNLHNGVVLVKTNNEFGIMDTFGNFKIELQPYELHLDDNGLILFKDSQYIYLDKDYNKYVLGKLNEPKRFMKGIGVEKAVDLYNHFKFINLKGEAITPYYSDVFPFYENVGMARNDSNLWAIINKEGKAITPFKYESILMDHGNQLYKDVHTGYEFSNPFLVTGKPIFARSAEYIDMFDGNGNQLNPISYNRLELCGRYIIAGLQKNKYEIRYGILNDKFQILVPFEYEQIKFYNLLKEKYFELKDLNHQFHNISLEEINKKQPH